MYVIMVVCAFSLYIPQKGSLPVSFWILEIKPSGQMLQMVVESGQSTHASNCRNNNLK